MLEPIYVTEIPMTLPPGFTLLWDEEGLTVNAKIEGTESSCNFDRLEEALIQSWQFYRTYEAMRDARGKAPSTRQDKPRATPR